MDRIDEVTKLFGVNCRSIRHAYEPVLDSLVALSEQTTDPVMQYHFSQAMRDWQGNWEKQIRSLVDHLAKLDFAVVATVTTLVPALESAMISLLSDTIPEPTRNERLSKISSGALKLFECVNDWDDYEQELRELSEDVGTKLVETVFTRSETTFVARSLIRGIQWRQMLLDCTNDLRQWCNNLSDISAVYRLYSKLLRLSQDSDRNAETESN